MTGMELSAQIWRDIAEIADDEALMRRLAKYLRHLAAQKPDPTEMTRDEFVARVRKAEKSPTRVFASVEELDRYITSRL